MGSRQDCQGFLRYFECAFNIISGSLLTSLKKTEAEKSDYRLCWLKELETDLAEEEPGE